MCGQPLPQVFGGGGELVRGHGLEPGVGVRPSRVGWTREDSRGATANRLAQCGRRISSQLRADWLDDVHVVGRGSVWGVTDGLEGSQAYHIVARGVEQGRGERVECRGGGRRIRGIEEGAHGIHGSHRDVGDVCPQKRANAWECRRIADPFEHAQQAGLVGDIGAGHSLEHLPQGGTSDDGEAGDGRLDGHGIMAGQQLVEQRLGLTGTGGHARGDCNA